MGKRQKFTPNDTTDPGRPRRKVPGPTSVMQCPCSVHRTAFLASHTQVTADRRGCPSLPLIFCQRVLVAEVYVCSGVHSPPLTPGLAGLKQVQWIMKRSMHRAHAPYLLPPLGTCRQDPPHSPQVHLALITLPAPWGTAAALRAEQGVLLPCKSPAPATIPPRCSFQTRIALMD